MTTTTRRASTTQNPRKDEQVQEVIEELKHKIRHDGWIADTRECMEEDLDRIDPESDHAARELVDRFREGWEETLHFEHHYWTPLYEALEEVMGATDKIAVIEKTHTILFEEIWNEYHKEHDTYQIAEELVKEA